ncbi:CKLF-like MARVEL transmembrane domain-containing protein 7 isoform X4 [Theropithecus gelada]|uniref:CKLF-like MARVEL transmembrane domain-containing protein 7 isoform X4 n=1 Tax=Theropithecus gelada TaxID=9565 RepID=UPI000DC15AE1|nr:CKLF-like MARVEL transmembrane domain-containing protein 7 isoform X4 [Theropithecus gelada]
MSHGAGLVRTTCSSGSALGPGAGAAQPSASPLEGLLDPSYPRTHAALLKVAQMVTLLIAFICVRSSPWTNYSAYSYFEVVTICDLIMILAFYLVHLFRFYRVLTCISWPLSMQLSDEATTPGPLRALQRGRVLQARPVDLCSCAKVLSGWWEPGKACPLFLLSPEASSQSS